MPKKFAKLSRVYATKRRLTRDQDATPRTNIKWHYYADNGPDGCSGCRDKYNGLWYAKIKVGNAEFWINACDKCKKKAGEI